MEKAEAIARLRAHETELRSMGIVKLSIFGSPARGDQRPDSDVDLAAALDYDAVRRLGSFGFFGIAGEIGELVGAKVNLVTEPVRKLSLKAEIDWDRVHVF